MMLTRLSVLSLLLTTLISVQSAPTTLGLDGSQTVGKFLERLQNVSRGLVDDLDFREKCNKTLLLDFIVDPRQSLTDVKDCLTKLDLFSSMRDQLHNYRTQYEKLMKNMQDQALELRSRALSSAETAEQATVILDKMQNVIFDILGGLKKMTSTPATVTKTLPESVSSVHSDDSSYSRTRLERMLAVMKELLEDPVQLIKLFAQATDKKLDAQDPLVKFTNS